MHAHKAKITVPEDHELKLTLPEDFPAGPAEIIVLTQGEDDEAVPVNGDIRKVLARGIREGWLQPASGPLQGPPPRRPVTNLDDVLSELDEDRADR